MIYLGIGASLGNRLETMRSSLKLLQAQGCELIHASSLYETPAWGGTATQPFLNAALEVSYAGAAPDLMDVLLKTEDLLGRVRGQRWADRSIDLDILEFHREVWAHPILTLPHPAYTSRGFVLQPLSDIAPGFIPTGTDKSVEEFLSKSEDSDIIRVSDPDWIWEA